jgi:hypothetical protein
MPVSCLFFFFFPHVFCLFFACLLPAICLLHILLAATVAVPGVVLLGAFPRFCVLYLTKRTKVKFKRIPTPAKSSKKKVRIEP